MAIIYYDKRAFVSAVSTTAAAGYPASNAISETLGRPWRATGVGNEDWTGTFAAAIGVHSFAVHDVNFAAATLQKSADGVGFTNVGALTTFTDRSGRRRGRLTVNDGNVKALRLQIAAGAATDGLGFWRMGCGYPWGSAHTVPADLQFPVEEQPVDPAVAMELSNGLLAEAGTGLRYSKIDTTWSREATESLLTLITKAKAGTVWFDVTVSDYPEQQWPLYMPLRNPTTERFDRFRFSRPSLSFLERV